MRHVDKLQVVLVLAGFWLAFVFDYHDHSVFKNGPQFVLMARTMPENAWSAFMLAAAIGGLPALTPCRRPVRIGGLVVMTGGYLTLSWLWTAGEVVHTGTGIWALFSAASFVRLCEEVVSAPD